MDTSGKKLKQLRLKHKLSIDEVAEATTVRSHIIADLEDDKDISLPQPYVISFIKSLLEFYERISLNPNLLKQEVSNETQQKTISKVNKPQKKHLEKIEIVDTNFFEEFENENISKDNILKSNISEENNNKNKNISQIKINSEETKEKFEEYFEDEGFELAPIPPTKDNKILNKEKNKKNTASATIIKEISTDTKLSDVTSSNIKKFNKKLSPKAQLYAIYSMLALFLLAVVYFVFFFNSTSTSIPEEKKTSSYDDDEDSTATDKDLLAKIESTSSDSLLLIANCTDTAWIKIDTDGNLLDEFVMLPGESRRWAAEKYIILSTSKIGNIKFYKNDTLLPMIGARGSLVKNIKITQEGILNIQPLENHNEPVAANAIHTNGEINPSQPDSTKKIKPSSNKFSINKRKNKEKQVEPIPILDFSTPPKTKPTGLD